MKNQTIREILKDSSVGDVLTNGVFRWRVEIAEILDDGYEVKSAIPIQESPIYNITTEAQIQTACFEISEIGPEAHSIMPGLRIEN